MGKILIKSNCGQPLDVVSKKTHNLKMSEMATPAKVLGTLKTGEELEVEADDYWHPNSVIIQTKTKFGDQKE